MLKNLKHPKRMSEHKDQVNELSFKDVEIDSKLVDRVEIKDDEEGLVLGMLAALEASKTKMKTWKSLSKTLQTVPSLFAIVKIKNDGGLIDLVMLATLETSKADVRRQGSRH